MEQNSWSSFGPEYIQEHFGSNRSLAVQQAVQNSYRNNPLPLPRMIATLMDLTGRESILDVGCGNGLILRELLPLMKAGSRIEAIDISAEMVKLAQRSVSHHWGDIRVQKGDAYEINTIFDQKFDRVMANFIMHYVDRPDEFGRSINRATKDDGIAIVTIEGRYSMPEMYLLNEIAMMRVGFTENEIRAVPSVRRGKIARENAEAFLSNYYRHVEETPYYDHLTFDTADAFMEFYRYGHKCCGIARILGEQDKAIEAVVEVVHAEVQRRIREFGFFELSKRISIFECREPMNA